MNTPHFSSVLSLFDGMSCGQIALRRAGIRYDNYFASEIDKHAIKVTRMNYPDTIQLGDVAKIFAKDLPKIDLLIGGTPCQGFSFAGKGLNFEDPRSRLFFEFVRLKNETQPRYWMLENVGMLEGYQDIISGYLGTGPILINSRLVSAQDRKRLYWTNIQDVKQPLDKNIGWDSISEDGWFAGSMRGRRINSLGKRDDYNKDIKIIQYIESRKDNKTNCLTTVSKDNIASKQKVGRTPLTGVEWRYLTRNEMERLQTVPDNYTRAVSLSQAGKMLGNGWTVDVIVHIFSNIYKYG
jgi:site-specific DNA-cytosine methylase